MAQLADDDIRALLDRDAPAGWRAFVDRYTPMLLALIERAGIDDYDEAMDVYLRTCERLAVSDCARLRQHDPSKGPWAAWLPTVVRHVIVDWVRARAGRPRLFAAVRNLPRLQQQVFELFYWQDRPPSEICEILTMTEGRTVTLLDVLEALDAIHAVLSERHHRELLAFATRARSAASLQAELERGTIDPVDPRADPERSARARELAAALSAALASLPPEDAAIFRLKYVQGLSHRDIEQALHIDRLTDDRLAAISTAVRDRLAARPALRLAKGGIA